MVLHIDYCGSKPSSTLTGSDDLYEKLTMYERVGLLTTGYKALRQTNQAYALHINNLLYGAANSSKVFVETGFLGLDCTGCSHLTGQLRSDLTSIERVEIFQPAHGVKPAFDIEILVHFAWLSVSSEWYLRVDQILI